MPKSNTIWLICTLFHTEHGAEITISQEGYSNLDDAKAFCESRHNGQVYDIDKFTYVSEPDEKNRYYEYKILNIHVKYGR